MPNTHFWCTNSLRTLFEAVKSVSSKDSLDFINFHICFFVNNKIVQLSIIISKTKKKKERKKRNNINHFFVLCSIIAVEPINNIEEPVCLFVSYRNSFLAGNHAKWIKCIMRFCDSISTLCIFVHHELDIFGR